MTKKQLIEKQRKQQEEIDRFNAKFSRPGAWSIGKELGETGAVVALGIRNAKISPRQDVSTPPADEQPVLDPNDAEAYCALMRLLPIHTELSEDDKVLAEVFREQEAFLELMEGPDEEDEKDERN